MKIYTARGDNGQTDLLFKARISKSDIIIDCLGDLDELNSFLGLSRAAIKLQLLRKIIQSIQTDIYVISSEVATKKENLNKLELRLSKGRLTWLENLINKLARKAKFEGCCFFIPGENVASSILDVCRTICRRAERKAVLLKQKSKLNNSLILAYLNRLSSLLFVAARLQEKSRKKFSLNQS